jgi:hypothetical protein
VIERRRSAHAELRAAQAELEAFARSCATGIGRFDLASAHHCLSRLQQLQDKVATSRARLLAIEPVRNQLSRTGRRPESTVAVARPDRMFHRCSNQRR